MKQYFNRTKKWNERCGVKTPVMFEFPKEEDLQLMSALAVEEAEEMCEAKSKSDVLDALADQQFVLWGNVARYGITWDEFINYCNKVIKSNESKFANNENEAMDSIEKEANRLGISEECITFVEVEGKWVIQNKDTGKVLKSINYVEPENI